MKEERLHVLKMVEEGKISVDDAAKLLETLKNTATYDNQWTSDGPSFDARIKEFAKEAENFAKEVGVRMNGLYKDVEPKIKKATQVVVEKTANIVDDISKTLHESAKHFDCQYNEDKPCCDDDLCENNCCEDDCCNEEQSDCYNDNEPREN